MKVCADELAVHEGDITDTSSIVRIIEDKQIIGFYHVEIGSDQQSTLEALFVDPTYMRQGFGSLLFEDAVAVLKERGCATIAIESEPHAQGFYEFMGAVCIGEVPSGSISGSMLPHFEYKIG